jgi:hypothetical protein
MLKDANKRDFDSSELTLAQARFVIDRAVADGKLSAGDLRRYHSSIESHVQDLHRQIAALTETGRGGPATRGRRSKAGRPRRGRKAGAVAAAASTASSGDAGNAVRATRRRRAPLTITPERREMMKIQGQFLSCRRRLPLREQKRFTEAYKAARTPDEKSKLVRKMVSTLK